LQIQNSKPIFVLICFSSKSDSKPQSKYRKKHETRNTDFFQADFKEANLSRADFSGADLTGAILEGTNTEGTNFCKATMPDGKFSQVCC
jgi:uncharacterized protein YjbI with pentapeptide repeats